MDPFNALCSSDFGFCVYIVESFSFDFVVVVLVSEKHLSSIALDMHGYM